MTVIDALPEALRPRIAIAPTGCWIWQGRSVAGGYRQPRWDGRDPVAHRLVYELLVGPIPDGLELDHLCRVTACCNPGHLEPVTHRENVLRGTSPIAHQARQTHCKHGHEFTAENTYIIPSTGSRSCRACSRARSHHKASPA